MPAASLLPDLSLATPAVAAINHLLAQEPWARDALRLHAGKLALIDAGSIAVRLQVTADGMLAAGTAALPAAVTIRMQLADLPLIAQQRDRAFSYVKIEGDAEFANTISQLSKQLRWEPEADLQRFAGPVLATRLAGSARALAAAAASGQRKFGENLAEFLTEEQSVLVRPAMLEQMGADIVRLRDDVERAAKRLARLEHQLNNTTAAAVLPPSLDR
ncbi:ubiquinone biosynthesis accessory factor UbiJ [Massilia sp. PWRC2]|uniref:ubiquinone biosynthesis accessory factor UbiJ n=1 Tax=Massilia sp. PWRC2 TaxID=2804626 RepID=UPI003CE870DD